MPTCTDFDRFYESPPWRFVVTDLDGVILTWMEKYASTIRVERNFGTPSSIQFTVPDDNPQVNIEADDGSPFLEEGNRLVYGFRRDCNVIASDMAQPWICRASGAALIAEDVGDADVPRGTFTFYDPWQVLYKAPVRDSDGGLPEQPGRVYPAGTRYDQIIVDQLDLMSTNVLPGVPIGSAFAFLDWGQTAEYGNTTGMQIEATAALAEDTTYQVGMSIGELITNLVATGDVEVLFTPIWDPRNRPGYTHELGVYTTAGTHRPNAVFAWDRWPRTLVGINRIRDGRERQNRIFYHASQGGPSVPEQRDPASVIEFGEYVSQQFFPGNESIASVTAMARRTLTLQSEGLITYKLSPTSALAPVPFVQYEPGDTVPVWSGDRLRRPILGDAVRIQSIPVEIGEDQLERVNGLLVSRDVQAAS